MNKSARMTTTNSRVSVVSIKKEFEEKTPKEKFKFFISCLVITACVSGLLFQLFQLFKQYYSGRTVVSVQIEITKFNKIPAITICYPNFFSMDLAAQKYPEQLGPLFDSYKSLILNVSEQEQPNKLEIQNIFDNFTQELKNSNLTIGEYFDISIPFGFPILSDMPFINNTFPISITVKGIRYFRGNNTMIDIEIEDTQPIESIMIGKDSYKCFTFFHMYNKKYRNYQIDEKEIVIEIYHNPNWFPSQNYDNNSKFLMFSMHSPSTFPEQMNGNNFLRLKAGKWYEITYNRLKTVLLPPPYETNCKKYNMDDLKDHRFRSDCISDCISDRLFKSCSGQTESVESTKESSNDEAKRVCFYSYNAIWRRDVIERNNRSSDRLCNNYPVNECLDRSINRVNRECQVKCHVECDIRFYNYNQKTNNKLGNSNLFTQISIEHNQLPDQVTEHIEEMSLIQFVASFGGLTGMWLGLSVVVIPHYLLKFV